MTIHSPRQWGRTAFAEQAAAYAAAADQAAAYAAMVSSAKEAETAMRRLFNAIFPPDHAGPKVRAVVASQRRRRHR